ncbi:nicotinate phosphoribosyltransferase [Actinotignum urinale]|uniref:Nicotinate phosphoribosyltransferase n=1 Tax=Actinotignum urinale TaxID=190146 RepID=A0AAW9HN24_9ACTO|nr:nicotinate phosphoribosyltransferase [Actinotignum urinale]MDY5129642.1 nicotinate phosphoribosyltransferase [Actinotignum urinale]MDY5151789.1 nicotinate phosphoribosyltransferase [Actinotignum urinale]MDY5155286.1 nicotinate phosphoribosyltransferase [Actinotignum urinale]WIK58786.1 nicotinate phosphoribosyltransferase [Actinotignum urinale]
MNSYSSSLLTDMYELTMIDAALKSGKASRKAVFEAFARRLPGGRRYGVVAGTGRLLDELANFRFTDTDIEYLLENNVISPETSDWFANYSFTGDLWGYMEGECYFPGSPILTAIGNFAECCIIETLALSILNYDSAVATAASRMTIAAHGRPCADFGARRTHEKSALAAARAAYIAGFSATSDLEAGRQYGIPVTGTSAHSFTLLHDSEEEAFRAQIAAMGANTTLLVDTYDVERGVERAVAAAKAAGGTLGAVRIDSGDLIAHAFKTREQLNALKSSETKITVTNDLDEFSIAALGAAPVDAYGVGTRLVTGSGVPTAQMVYKLVEREGANGTMHEVAKASKNKHSIGGLKVAGRTEADGRATGEIIVAAESFEKGLEYVKKQGARPLQVKLIDGGVINDKYRGRAVLESARNRHQDSRNALPYSGWRLSPGEPVFIPQMIDIHE